VEPLQNGAENISGHARGHRRARRTITFETYIYWSGRSASNLRFADRQVPRGVRVHVMLDWGMREDVPQPGALMQAQHRSGPLPSTDMVWALELNNRTHRKVLIIDGATVSREASESPISGSVTRRTRINWRDMHFRAEDPWSRRCRRVSRQLDQDHGRVLHGEGTSRHWPPGPQRCSCSSVRRRAQRQHAASCIDRDNAAERSIDIEAAYFIPDTLMIRELLGARDRGVRIRCCCRENIWIRKPSG